jgi:hypothetical protein
METDCDDRRSKRRSEPSIGIARVGDVGVSNQRFGYPKQVQSSSNAPNVFLNDQLYR